MRSAFRKLSELCLRNHGNRNRLRNARGGDHEADIPLMPEISRFGALVVVMSVAQMRLPIVIALVARGQIRRSDGAT